MIYDKDIMFTVQTPEYAYFGSYVDDSIVLTPVETVFVMLPTYIGFWILVGLFIFAVYGMIMGYE